MEKTRLTLARTYEQAGNMRNALETYRCIVQEYGQDTNRDRHIVREARSRMSALLPRAELERRSANGMVGVRVSPSSLPPREQRVEWIRNLKEGGITFIVLDVGTPPPLNSAHGSLQRPQSLGGPEQPAGVYFQTQWASVVEDLIDQVVPVAHEQGLNVFGVLTLRRMPWVEPSAGWADRVYDPGAQQVQRGVALDLFHPGFQKYLLRLCTDLAHSGIDGVVFSASAPVGPYDGFTRDGLDGFREQFGEDLDVRALFIAPQPSAITEGMDPLREEPAHTREFSQDFWRWAGWKARERVKVFAQLMHVMRDNAPTIQFVLEVHPEAVTHPVRALAQYSEDLAEGKRAGFDGVLTQAAHWDSSQNSMSHPVQLGQEPKGAREALDQMTPMARFLDLVGTATQLWVSRPGPPRVTPQGRVEGVTRPSDQAGFPGGIGMVFGEGPLFPIP